MPIFIDTTRRFWLPGIQNTEASPDLNFSDWLVNTDYYIHSIKSASEFVIRLSTIEQGLPLFASTSNRVFSDCFETIASTGEIERSPRSIAWLLIKIYYAAFFAAHGHMRICGTSCTNLDAKDAANIFETARLNGVTGPVNKIESGQYKIEFNASSLTMSFSSVGSKKSHEALWFVYKEFIEKMEADIPSIIAVKQQQDQVLKISKYLRSILCMDGATGGNWLSRFRNSVQYRHAYGVWHPYSLEKSVPPKLISSLLGHFQQDADKANLLVANKNLTEEIDTFFRASTFLSALGRSTIIDLCRRSTNPKALVKRGSISFLRHSKLD